MFAGLAVILFNFASGLTAQEEAPPKFTPKQAMDFFAGDWRGIGQMGSSEYSARETAEWDLHHNIMSHRLEFFGGKSGNTLALVRWWDPLKKKVTEHQFARPAIRSRWSVGGTP
jgi:hypothetical protein